MALPGCSPQLKFNGRRSVSDFDGAVGDILWLVGVEWKWLLMVGVTLEKIEGCH